ncbi:MAG: trypsin-like peptidase domain-containing protein, partial [Phycisphaerae bacterium]|nr:trypsin-like peptidase domain-containing protein [Phycisphaerae bacterium]
MSRNKMLVSCLAVLLMTLIGFPVQSAEARPNLDKVEQIIVPPLDLEAIQVEDEQREREGLAPRYAIPTEALLRPTSDGTWETLDNDMCLWRLRITSPGAVSLNLGFTAYSMPPGGELRVYAVDGSYEIGPFTKADNETHGELWTPVVLSDDIVVEVTIPSQVEGRLILELTSINVGYRGFGALHGRDPGWCNIDVICPEGDNWRDEIPAIGVISTGGSLFCTGFMLNNTAQDETPYFITAYHCGIHSGNAASLVVHWNYESPTCGPLSGGSLSQYQTGSFHRASYTSSDVTLVELDSDPNPAYGITFAGWNRGTGNASSAVAIHHPDTGVKCISFENQPCTTTSYLGTSSPGDGTHIRVADWDLGTTEPGSSGSPLFDQNHRVVGQLHGGYAACGNDEPDWYGRFSVSWSHGLSGYLDPLGTGATYVDTLVPGSSGLQVTPTAGFDSAGPQGGPFTPSSKQYLLENMGTSGFNYSVTKTQSWVSLSNSSGYLSGGGTAYVTVSINSNANSLGNGTYNDTVSFINTTTHEGDTTRPVTLQVGAPSLQYSFPMSSNPGWSTEGQWEFGQPTGQGGDHGGPDPTSGYTGYYVYGYNLDGDYPNNLSERHLTSTALDCSNLTDVSLKFRRWLGVERNLYDHAYVRASNNGSTWTLVWENGSEVADTSWQLLEYDISAVADEHATVYLRWTMGSTDDSWRYCGWNIDDVEIWGVSSSGPTGACCHADGSCTETTQAGCSGTWQGSGTDCSPNPCPQPSGACCYTDGSCAETIEANCSGDWQGAGTDCDPNPCPQPLGACCYADGSCNMRFEYNCSGTWQGMGTDCDPNPCPQPGACCHPDGSCTETLEANCSGDWQGAGTDCDPNP